MKSVSKQTSKPGTSGEQRQEKLISSLAFSGLVMGLGGNQVCVGPYASFVTHVSQAFQDGGRGNTMSRDEAFIIKRHREVSRAGKQLMKSWTNGPSSLRKAAAQRAGSVDFLSQVSLSHPRYLCPCCFLYVWVLLSRSCFSPVPRQMLCHLGQDPSHLCVSVSPSVIGRY